MSEMNEKNEKRKFSRNAAKIKSEVHSSDGMTYSTTQDVSDGGLFISTPEPVRLGSEINLTLKADNDNEILIKGIVRWMKEEDSEESKAGMGIEFVDVNAENMEMIKKIMK